METLPRVGPAVRTRLAKLGLRTLGDLLYHRPRRYRDIEQSRCQLSRSQRQVPRKSGQQTPLPMSQFLAGVSLIGDFRLLEQSKLGIPAIH